MSARLQPREVIRLLAFAAIGIGGLLALGELYRAGWLEEGRLLGLLAPLGPWVYPAFVLTYAVAIMIWAPGMVLAILAAALFHPIVAVSLTWCAFLIGATGSYGVARLLGREAVMRMVERRGGLAVRAAAGFQDRAFLSVFLLRVLGTPNNLPAYLAGVAGVPFRVYMLATVTGMIAPLTSQTLAGGILLEVIQTRSLRPMWSTEGLWTAVAFSVGMLSFLFARRWERSLRARRDAIANASSTEPESAPN